MELGVERVAAGIFLIESHGSREGVQLGVEVAVSVLEREHDLFTVGGTGSVPITRGNGNRLVDGVLP